MKNRIIICLIAAFSGTQLTAQVTVAKDGSGNFTTVQAAIDAAPVNATTPYTITIKNGVYKEKITVASNKTFINLVGESVANTILTFDDFSGKPIPGGGGATYGTSNSASVTVNANDFTAVNISFENTTGEAPQALAINVNGDRSAFKNCRFLGGQDTLLANGTGSKRMYFKQCYIDGTVDFIFGSAAALFEDCTIYPKTRSASGGSYMTAANTSAGQAYGYVFKNCIIQMNRGGTAYVLARPWQNPPSENKTIMLNTTMSGTVISPAGWAIWDALTQTSLITYGEYQSVTQTGAAVDVSARVAWSLQLNATQAATYTNANMFGTWDPCGAIANMCTSTTLDIAVANLKAVKGASTSVFTWNASWGIVGVAYEFQRSTDNQATFTTIYTATSVDKFDVNFTYTDANPPAGATYYYRVVASKSGLASHTTVPTNVSSTPTITVGTLGGFSQGLGLPSLSQSYTLSAVNLLGDLTITVPAPYQISIDGGTTWSGGPLSITPVSGTISSRTVGVRLNSMTAGTFSGNILNASSGAVDANVAVTGVVQTDPLPISVVLASFPLTANNAEDAAARAIGLTVSAPTFMGLTLSNGTTVSAVPAYSTLHGQAYGASTNGDGTWTTAAGGPGGNVNLNNYEQFTITANAGYSVRVDSFTLNPSFYNTSSNTRLAVLYSKAGFASDIGTATGGIAADGTPLVTTATTQNSALFTTTFPVGNNTAGNTVNMRLALNSSTGVTIAAGQTLTVRLYFACGSGSAGRYAKIKDVFFKGLAIAAVPISLTAFSGEKSGNGNRLKWTTASETNNAFFAIERSDNGLDFKSIGQVKGAGTTGTPQYYGYFDDIPLPNINYYRIKQVDFDGKFMYSKIIAIDNAVKTSGIVKLSPSVVSNILNVDVESDDVALLRISDAAGRVILTKNIVQKGFSTVTFDTHTLPNGVYLISFVTALSVKTEKFIKQ
jgi:pectin methylesterase-like acyl-CoA thioesterase